jgi:hypothetical protein
MDTERLAVGPHVIEGGASGPDKAAAALRGQGIAPGILACARRHDPGPPGLEAAGIDGITVDCGPAVSSIPADARANSA